jgi:hypothetical protein
LSFGETFCISAALRISRDLASSEESVGVGDFAFGPATRIARLTRLPCWFEVFEALRIRCYYRC